MATTLGMIAPGHDVLLQMLACAGVGGALGTVIAKKIEITDLPQLVAAFHRLVHLYVPYYLSLIKIYLVIIVLNSIIHANRNMFLNSCTAIKIIKHFLAILLCVLSDN